MTAKEKLQLIKDLCLSLKDNCAKCETERERLKNLELFNELKNVFAQVIEAIDVEMRKN